MIELSPTQRRALRAQAHHLNPVVTIAGNGLTPSVIAEIRRSLQAHELIKIRVQGTERDKRTELLETICHQVEAAPVQHIGNILIIWRERHENDEHASIQGDTPASSPNRGTAKAAAPRPATAKSAAAFAAAARRAALIRASAEKRPSAARALSSSRSPRQTASGASSRSNRSR